MLRVPVDHLECGEYRLDDRAAHYLARVRRVQPGERVILFDPARSEQAVADLLTCGKHGVVCRVGPIEPASRELRPAVVLLQGIGKGDKYDMVVRDATELGATRIVAVETARTIVRLGERADARIERWRRIAAESARQSGRWDAPDLEGPLSWGEALTALPEPSLRLCLWENATEPIGIHLLRGSRQPIVLAVGPEGGLEPVEVEKATEAGFVAVSLGSTILRTETVAAAVLGAVLVMRQVAGHEG